MTNADENDIQQDYELRTERSINQENHMDTSEEQSNFDQLLNSEGFFEVIKEKVCRTPAEILLGILKFGVSNTLSLKGISDLLKFVNNIFSEQILPESSHFINKYFNPRNRTEFHGICSNTDCGDYLGQIFNFQEKLVCPTCKKEENVSKITYRNFFMLIDPSESIRNVIERYDTYFCNLMEETSVPSENIKDIYNGQMYQDLRSKLQTSDGEKNYATCIFNTDGASPFKSSKSSLWPIHLMINEIPPAARFKNIITCGLWFGKSKPNMLVYLKPFVELFNNKLSSAGVECTINNQKQFIKIHCIVCSCDSVARASVQGIKQFNGKCGCSWCDHPGEYLDTNRYSSKQEYSLRDNLTTIREMQVVAQTGIPSNNGIKYPSPLILLPHFDIVKGFVPDYMHSCILGVSKQITNLILLTLDSSLINVMDELVMNIKIPLQLARVTRSLKDRAVWKAKEWESWLLYYSLPCLSVVADSKLVSYWALFVKSIYLLLKFEISSADLKNAKEMLVRFSMSTESIFGIYEMTYNIHILDHIVDSVLHWGPLWAHSCYFFESSNRYLLFAINAEAGVNFQISRYLNLKLCVLRLEKRVIPFAPEIFIRFYEKASNMLSTASYQFEGRTYFGNMNITEEDRNTISNCLKNDNQLEKNRNTVIESTIAYPRLLKNNFLYSTSFCKSKRTNSSFAKLTDNSFIRIRKFLLDQSAGREYTLCNKVHVCRNSIAEDYSSLKQIISIDEDVDLVDTKSILILCIYIQIQDKQFVCELANPYGLYT